MAGRLLRSIPIVARMRRRARMSRAEMLAYQLAQFRRLVGYVWPRSAFYRELYSDHGIREDHLKEITPADLPVVEKRQLMENFDRAVTDPAVRFADVVAYRDRPEGGPPPQLRPYYLISTSGSTGEPALLLQDDACWLTTQVALLVRLIYRKGRRRLAHRRAFCGGSFHMGAGALMTKSGPRFIPEPLILSPQEPLERTVEKLNGHNPTLLTGFTSRIAMLAAEALAGRLEIDPEVVGSSGENLTPGMEEDIERAWPGRHVNAYSASESLCVMARRYRKPFTVFDDLNVVEVVDGEGTRMAAGETGEVVLTNLHNRILPFIRYRMADIATVGGEPEKGPFSVVESLLGRDKDAIPIIRDDGTLGEIPAVSFASFVAPSLKQFRLVLKAPDVIEVQYVATADLEEALRGRIDRSLQRSEAANRMRVEVKRMERLPIDPKTNKVRFTEVLCDVGAGA